MARSYTTLPLTDDHGLPLINVVVEGYDASDDSLVETAYTGTAGTAAFTSLPDDANYYFIARWGNKTLRWTRDFTLPTKQWFYPVTAYGDASIPATAPLDNDSNFAVAPMTNQYDFAMVSFRIPHDFNGLTSAYLIFKAGQTKADAAISIYSSAAAVGEAITTHQEQDALSTYSITDTHITQLDISGILTLISANDYGCVRVYARETLSLSIIGVMIYYQ